MFPHTTTITLFAVRTSADGVPLRIAAIKFLRAMATAKSMHMGLKEGKALVDHMLETGARCEIVVAEELAPVIRQAAERGFVTHEPQSHVVNFNHWCNSHL